MQRCDLTDIDDFSLIHRNADSSPIALRDDSDSSAVHPKTYFKMGLQAVKNNPDEAIEHFTSAIEIDPEYVKAYVNRGTVYFNQKKYDLALIDFNRALGIKPDYARAWLNRGATHQAMGLLTEAIRDYTRAIDYNPKCRQAHKRLAAACHALTSPKKTVSVTTSSLFQTRTADIESPHLNFVPATPFSSSSCSEPSQSPTSTNTP